MELTEHIRDKVKEALMIAMPEEDLDTYIKQEMHQFFKTDDRGYPKQSLFAGMIKNEIENRVRVMVSSWLDNNLDKVWDSNTDAYKMVGQAVKALAPVVMEAWGAHIAQAALGMVRNQLESGRY